MAAEKRTELQPSSAKRWLHDDDRTQMQRSSRIGAMEWKTSKSSIKAAGCTGARRKGHWQLHSGSRGQDVCPKALAEESGGYGVLIPCVVTRSKGELCVEKMCEPMRRG